MDPPESQMNPVGVRNSFTLPPGKASYRPAYNRSPPSAATFLRRQYRLGDTAHPSDVNIPQSVGEHIAAVEKLSEGGHCFILRSDFSFTYALVTKHEAGILELQVNEDGGSKAIPKDHWKKYIRTLITSDSPKKQSPIGGQSKQVRSRHLRRSSAEAYGYERSPRHSSHVTPPGKKKSESRSSMPNLAEEGRRGHSTRSQSKFRQQRYYSSSGSDDSSTGSSREVEGSKKSSTTPELPFPKDYKRSESQQDRTLLKKQEAHPRRRVTVSERPSIPSIPTKEFKRSVSIQGGDVPIKKCLKSDQPKRSQSEGGDQHRRYESSESDSSSSSSFNSSFSFDSTDDSSLRAQHDLNRLLSKSMPSLRQGRGSEGSLHGAFGDVTKIEILD
mmetsp:Transcript_15050/g.24576  ORF Transcript_15050/g.24576 Transcript_15050/m.24576 type:complete len:386 (+) Transcript_15050:236-1393(+)